MKLLIIGLMLATTATVFADQSFVVSGKKEKVKIYGNLSYHQIVTDEGNRFALSKESAEAYEDCDSGQYEIVADNPVKPNYYVLLAVLTCEN